MDTEIWQEHPIHRDYEGSTHGRIRSWRALGRGKKERMEWPRLLAQRVSNRINARYMVCTIEHDKGGFVHRFIAECFIENPDGKPQVNHKDGNKLNNRPDNLEWVTCGENHAHSYQAGLRSKKGEKHHLNKLTEVEVLAIRDRFRQGETQQQLADGYGITQTAISAIITGKRWSHLPGAIEGDQRKNGRPKPTLRKLTPEQRDEIRRLNREEGLGQKKLAALFGVANGTIWNVLKEAS